MSAVASLRAASAGLSVRPALAVLVLVATLLAGCAGTEGAAGSPVATTTVDLPKSYRFAPAEITVPARSTVTWTNNDNFTHNVTMEGVDPLPLAPGETASFTFDSPGVYAYVCSLHPRDMTGSVTVTGS